MAANEETPQDVPKFDFDAFPPDTLFFDRRDRADRRHDDAHAAAESGPILVPDPTPPPERRDRKPRRKRIDPTTFEKQYTDDELEFMNAMQRFKVQSGKAFPNHGEVLKVALALGYRRVIADGPGEFDSDEEGEFEESGMESS